jgi:predicted aminopeptidase
MNNIVTMTNPGSGYINTSATQSQNPTIGELRYSVTNANFEVYNGFGWIPRPVVDSSVAEDVISQIKKKVIDHIRIYHTDNSTIYDALDTWIEACEKLQVVIALAGKNK